MMSSPLPLLLLALTTALSAPTALDDDYSMVVPEKRAALVLDRLLVALQKALHEDAPRYQRPDREGPRTAPLRLAHFDTNDLMALSGEDGAPATQLIQLDSGRGARFAPLRLAAIDDDTSALQRRGQPGAGRGRVLRCYFNAVTCF